MILMIDGCMISRFVNDSEAFTKFATDHFHSLDADGNGALSRSDHKWKSDWFFALDLAEDQVHDDGDKDSRSQSDSIFEKFDADRSNTIDEEEFRRMLMEMMLAFARGIGNTPVNVVVEEDGNSVLAKAYEYELARIEREREREEEKRRKEQDSQSRDDNAAKTKKEKSGKVVIISDRRDSGDNANGASKLKKKRSSKMLGFCACGGKYLGDDS